MLRQNYDTGEHLNNSIQYYNSLIRQQDSIAISNIFKIPIEQRAKSLNFLLDQLSENNK